MEASKVNIPLLRVSAVRVQTEKKMIPEIIYYRKRGDKGEMEESFKITMQPDYEK